MANLIYKGSKASLPTDRNAASFYLCEDTRELYFGANLYTEAVRFYTNAEGKPATPAQGVLYVNTDTGAGDAWDGSAWKNVIKGYATEITVGADDTTVPTTKAAKDYIDKKVEDVVAGSIDGLGALASKDEVTEDELGADLATKINGKAEQTALDDEIARAKAAEKVNANAIEVLNGTGEGSVDKKIDDAFNKFATNVTDDGVINSYKELIDWAAEHGGDAAEMAAAISKLEAIVDGIGGDGEKDTVVAYVTDAIEALKIGDYAKAADLAALADRVTTLEGKAHEHKNKDVLDGINATRVAAWDVAEQNAKNYTDGKDTAMDTRVTAVETALTVGTF